jgi:hypothetical protein
MPHSAHGPEVPHEAAPATAADSLRDLKAQTARTMEFHGDVRGQVMAERVPVINRTEDLLKNLAQRIGIQNPARALNVPAFYRTA